MIIHKIGQFVIFIICGGLGLVITAVSGWLLFNAYSGVGRGLAVLGLAIAVLLVTPPGRWVWPIYHIFWQWGGWIAGAIIGGTLVTIVLVTPDGNLPPGSPVHHRFTGNHQFQRYSFTNIIPEIEQVNLGLTLAPYFDFLITPEQTDRVSEFTLKIYQEMESDPDFHQLGSVMGWAYAELLGRPFDVGHYYLYVPKAQANGPRPAIIFLHGSAGNFKAYTWAWAKFAEEQGFVIIAPSFGFGNWLRSGGTASVLRALEDAAEEVELDLGKIYLAGLSNGGLGVSHLAAASPEKFRGLIFLSPVMATEIVDSPAFLEAWQGRPILVITGEADDRIPVSYVESRVAVLERGGVDVTYIAYPGENHFLFFSQLTSVLDDITDWLPQ